jgi:chaperonin cofactor prefoldin
MSAGSSQQQQMMPPAYQEKLDALKVVNASLRELVNRQQLFDAQHTENAMVKQELDALRSDEPVFKLHGQVLVRQDTQEAKATVGQRIKMIEGELCVHCTPLRCSERDFSPLRGIF